MRRIILVVAVALLMALALPTGAALAQEGPELNDNNNNCGGVSSFQTIDLLGSGEAFGDLVSDVAEDQGIDNNALTHANCANNEGQKP